jgi:hypothetical protein
MTLRMRQEGQRVDHTPGAAVAAGAVIVQNGQITGVATSDIEANALGSLDATPGRIYEVVASGAIPTPALNDLVYAIPATGLLTKTSSGNVLFGKICALVPLSVRAMFALLLCCSITFAQNSICTDGRCDNGRINLEPLQEEIDFESQYSEAASEDRFTTIVRATVRVTVSGVCGSGTIVGRDANGVAIVLTNAHVAGTQRGRVVQLERWNTDGSSERGQGSIIASGYGRGLSVDFALLKCNEAFAKGVTTVPIANRYPKGQVTTYGCPRCEWPSMQNLSMRKNDSQILTWKPEAIGGRSGSSLIDYDEGPRVVGLLTWGGGGEGLGQSSPFLLEAMKGRLPASIEGLPPGVKEVDFLCCASYPTQGINARSSESVPADQGLIDSITTPGNKPSDEGEAGRKPLFPRDPEKPLLPIRERPILDWIGGWVRSLLLFGVGVVVGAVGSFLAIRFFRIKLPFEQV